MKRLAYIIIFFLTGLSAFATHNRAGEITYVCDPDNVGNYLFYEITITTYTKESSQQADRCELEIKYGDGEIDTITRTNGLAGGCGNDQYGNPIGMGVSLANDIKMNKYVTRHLYPGPGTYIISMEDPNRNEGIVNIPNSVNKTFFIRSKLIISNLGCNSTPILTNPPIDNGCVMQIYEHNPGAIDTVDGDSLVFSITQCLGAGGVPITDYSYPHQSGIPPGCTNVGSSLSIDPVTGTLTWNSPQCQGEYNICILIQEYRNGVKIGSVLRDMQITIGDCDNVRPEIQTLSKICIIAGDTIDSIPITAIDPNGDNVTLTATGEPFTVASSPAVFTQPVSGDSTVTEYFYWETVCSHIRKQPYYVVFRAEDNNIEVNLVDYETMEILVIGPPPLNPSATAIQNSIQLDWDPPVCANAEKYNIYRRIDTSGWTPDTCETGVPAYTGFSLIATVNGLNNTSYIDDDGGAGLIHGQQYCYRIVAVYPNNTEGKASDEVCAELKKDVPVITHVSVNATDISTGSDTIIWSMPTEADTVNNFTAPYHYKIYRATGFNDPSTPPIAQTPASLFLAKADTIYVDNGLNTEGNAYTYKIELYDSAGLVGSTHNAASIWLSSIPSDNKLQLVWQEDVPWTNHEYVVYRFNNVSSNWAVLDTVSTKFYADSGLVNGKEYCYYIRSIGSYSTSGFINPIFNNSQEHCNAPVDTTAPCAPPNPFINRDCDLVQNTLTWNNPNNTCSDDVVGYMVYYAPVLGQQLQLIDSVKPASNTKYVHDGLTSVAGCYAITSVDSFQNESVFSQIVCTDNCPMYSLPNVFTPNGDGINDHFMPFPYKFVESIDLEILNRWGQVVFTTEDPSIMWDGRHRKSGVLCSAGVYYYVCEVHEIRLTGIETRILKGYIQMLPSVSGAPPR